MADWLNGWPRNGNGVIVGAMVHCAGCGADRGLICLAITGDEVWPTKDPDWPFPQEDCPVCSNRRERDIPFDELVNLPQGVLRRALIASKKLDRMEDKNNG